MTEDMRDALENRRLVRVYRDAFGVSDSGDVDDYHRLLLDDIEKFCGLRQAKFTGDQHEIIKAMGRIEVLGRIRYFLTFPDDDYQALMKLTEMDDE